MRALVVVDLGFGDAGKGLLTDFLVRHTGAKAVVRYNGGAQAGHNVVTPDGRHHTFSQFGSGSFVPGVRTFLSREVVVHPTALLREEAHLRAAGLTDAFARLDVSADALVITPFQQALGRVRELARGDARHGSCGVGVGETVAHARGRSGEGVRVRDLSDRDRLRRTLRRIRDHAWQQVCELGGASSEESEIFHRPDVIEQWMEASRVLASRIADDDAWVPESGGSVVFEGAQGVLLDEWHGFHPHTTWGTCTSAPAHRLLAEAAPDAYVSTIGVLRAYAVRHGAGPFPTEADVPGPRREDNAFNAWQGSVRRGWFDAVLARYALEADGAVDALAITHLDWLETLARWTWCERYLPEVALRASAARSLDAQERLTERLRSVRPLLRHCAADELHVLEAIEEAAGRRVAIGSRGPSADRVFIRVNSLKETNRGPDRRCEVG